MAILFCYVSSDNKENLKSFFKSTNPVISSGIVDSFDFKDSRYHQLLYGISLNIKVNTRPLQRILKQLIGEPNQFKKRLDQYGLCMELVFDLNGIGQFDYIPGAGWSPSFISICSTLQPYVFFKATIRSPMKYTEPDSGVYFYAYPINNNIEIPVLEIETVAGINYQAIKSIIRKGGKIFYGKSVSHNEWAIEIEYKNAYPEQLINDIMKIMIHPDSLGQYLARRKMRCHIDITRYGIGPEQVLIVFPPCFFTFCHQLKVRWIAIDTMI